MVSDCKAFLSDRLEIPTDLVLDESYREELSRPKGAPLTDPTELVGRSIISVGDRVTKTLLESGVEPRVTIVDLIERRKERCDVLRLLDRYLILTASNPRGKLTREAWTMTSEAIHLTRLGVRTTLLIDGEEDLLGFSAVILSPEGWVMVYGQPGVGMIQIEVTRDVKERAIDLLCKAFRPL